jgi:hypothetical protein
MKTFGLVAGIGLLLATAAAFAEEFPVDIRAALDNAGEFELLSIDPNPRAPGAGEKFHGYGILGRTLVSEAQTRRELVNALEQGVHNADMMAACFKPRHGVRATRNGISVDLVICFECGHARVYRQGASPSGLLTTGSPEPVFDGVLRSANLPLARDVEKERSRLP